MPVTALSVKPRNAAQQTPAHDLGSDGGVFRLPRLPSSPRGPILIRARTISGRSSLLARITARTAATPTSDGGTAKTTQTGNTHASTTRNRGYLRSSQLLVVVVQRGGRRFESCSY